MSTIITTTEVLRSLPDGTYLQSGDHYKQYEGAIWLLRGGFLSRVGRELEGVTPIRYFVDPLPVTVVDGPAIA